MVDSATTKQIVTGYIVFLPDTVSTVFALTAIGIRPSQFDERHIGRCCQRKSDTGSFDGTDDELHIGVVLKSVYRSLFAYCAVTPCNRDGTGEYLLQFIHNLVKRTEYNEFLSAVKECSDKINRLCNLSFCGQGAQGHKPDKSLHAHFTAYFPICTLCVFLRNTFCNSSTIS